MSWTATTTFAFSVENHAGMQMLGALSERGHSLADLQQMAGAAAAAGERAGVPVTTEIYCLNDALAGAPQACGDLDFKLVSGAGGEEMVEVAEPKSAVVRGDFLVRHIQKFEEITRDLDDIVLPTPAEAAAAAAAAAPPAPPVAAH